MIRTRGADKELQIGAWKLNRLHAPIFKSPYRFTIKDRRLNFHKEVYRVWYRHRSLGMVQAAEHLR